MLKVMHVNDREQAESEFRAAVKRGGSFEIVYRMQHADGDWRLIRDRGFCAHDQHGEPTRVLGIMVDITDQREAG